MVKDQLSLWAGPLTILVGELWLMSAVGDFAFQQAAGITGQIGLSLSVAACVGLIVAVLVSILLGGAAPEIAQGLGVNYAVVVCIVGIRLGYLLLGVSALQSPLLPRWNLLPLLVGLSVVLSLPFEWFGVSALLPVPGVTPFWHFAVSGACWVMLGIVMLDQRPAIRLVETA